MAVSRDELSILDEELTRVGRILASLTKTEWSARTLLVPASNQLPPWTVRELAGHLGFALHMLEMLLATPSSSTAELDRVSFFDQPGNVVAPAIYQMAWQIVEGKTNAEVLDYCLDKFDGALTKARLAHPGFTGSAIVGVMRFDEFVPTRIVEAVVHGLDLAQALGRTVVPSADAVAVVAEIFDALHLRKRATARPPTLPDDWLWVQSASGRLGNDAIFEPLLS